MRGVASALSQAYAVSEKFFFRRTSSPKRDRESNASAPSDFFFVIIRLPAQNAEKSFVDLKSGEITRRT